MGVEPGWNTKCNKKKPMEMEQNICKSESESKILLNNMIMNKTNGSQDKMKTRLMMK